MEIVACFDHGFVMPTGVMMHSVCKNNKDVEVNFHFFVDKSVSEEDRNDLLDIISGFKEKTITFYTMDSSLFEEYPSGPKRILGKSAYYRMSVAEILPKTIHKVLYLDGDVIVRQSLLPLWDTDLSGFAVAAVFEKAYQMFSGYGDYFKRLEYPPELGYFNSGVMLINLDFWRRNGIGKQLKNYVHDHPEKIKLVDQDVLNYVLRDSKLELPTKCNLQSSMLYAENFDMAVSEDVVRVAVEAPMIVHFICEKPWDKYVRDPHPYRSTFFKYQNETKWKGQRIDKRPMKMRVVNAVADLLRYLKLKTPLKPLYANINPID